MVRCRLDRALANEEWHSLFPCFYTEYLGMVASDHCPMVAYLEIKIQGGKGNFVLIRDELDKKVFGNQLECAGQIIVTEERWYSGKN